MTMLRVFATLCLVPALLPACRTSPTTSSESLVAPTERETPERSDLYAGGKRAHITYSSIGFVDDEVRLLDISVRAVMDTFQRPHFIDLMANHRTFDTTDATPNRTLDSDARISVNIPGMFPLEHVIFRSEQLRTSCVQVLHEERDIILDTDLVSRDNAIELLGAITWGLMSLGNGRDEDTPSPPEARPRVAKTMANVVACYALWESGRVAEMGVCTDPVSYTHLRAHET